MQPIMIKEKEYLNLFKISIFLKGINAFIEIIGGVIVWFTSKVVLVTFILNLLQNELSDDPKDYVANFIVNSAEALAVSSQYFFGAYLFFHGLIKIILITGLFRKKMWAYPTSIVVFSLFIVYQSYRFYITYSLWIFLLTLFDIFIVLLAIHEYGVLRKKRNSIRV